MIRFRNRSGPRNPICSMRLFPSMWADPGPIASGIPQRERTAPAGAFPGWGPSNTDHRSAVG
ncbi:MAG: hypothetical protein CMJ23_11210 [Phycisphaerae bacterium]|nr:hypothetical protein [Phycisphaerae bacterium]